MNGITEDSPIDRAPPSDERLQGRSGSQPEDAVAHRSSVREELTDQLYRQAPIGILATLVNSSILAVVLWNVVGHQKLRLWLAVTALGALLRYGLVLAYRNNARKPRPAARWRNLQVGALAISGLLWGSTAILFFPISSTAHQAFIAFVLAGMVAGAVGIGSSVLAASVAFSWPALTPILVRFLLVGDALHTAMGVMTLFFLLLTTATAWHINGTATELVRLKDQFAEKVAEQTSVLMRANQELKLQIVDRQRAQEHLRQSLKEKEVLLKEVHHRVKNNLAVIISLLKMQGSRIVDPADKAALQDSYERVEAMALVHETLYRSENLSAIPLAPYARNLAANLIQMMVAKEERSAIRVVIEAEGIYLPIDAAMPCALILNELLTNALKYAFAPRKGGEILIGAQTKAGVFELSFRDNGIGFPAGLDLESGKTLGFRIISVLVKHQMEGAWEATNDPGAWIRIRWPIPTAEGCYDRIAR